MNGTEGHCGLIMFQRNMYFSNGVKLMNQGDYSGAQMQFRIVLQNIQDVQSLYQLARCQQLTSHYQQAITVYQQVFKINPSDPRPLYQQGIIYEKQNQLDQAILLYEQAAHILNQYIKEYENDTKFSIIHYKLGCKYQQRNETEKARRAFEQYMSYNNLSDKEKTNAQRRLQTLDEPLEVSQTQQYKQKQTQEARMHSLIIRNKQQEEEKNKQNLLRQHEILGMSYTSINMVKDELKKDIIKAGDSNISSQQSTAEKHPSISPLPHVFSPTQYDCASHQNTNQFQPDLQLLQANNYTHHNNHNINNINNTSNNQTNHIDSFNKINDTRNINNINKINNFNNINKLNLKNLNNINNNNDNNNNLKNTNNSNNNNNKDEQEKVFEGGNGKKSESTIIGSQSQRNGQQNMQQQKQDLYYQSRDRITFDQSSPQDIWIQQNVDEINVKDKFIQITNHHLFPHGFDDSLNESDEEVPDEKDGQMMENKTSFRNTHTIKIIPMKSFIELTHTKPSNSIVSGPSQLTHSKFSQQNEQQINQKQTDFEHPEKDLSAYVLKKQLGQGSYGRVFEVIYKNDGNSFALKIIPHNSILRQHLTSGEIDVMKSLNHKNIIKIYNAFKSTDQQSYCIISELADNGTLKEYIQKRKGNVEKYEVLNLMKQMVTALNYIHSQRIIHRDIKPGNIFLHGNSKQIKIGDFGIAKKLTNKEVQQDIHSVGTQKYFSPEYRSKGFSEKSDIWSMGIVFLELLGVQVQNELTDQHKKLYFKQIPPEMTEIIAGMTQIDPSIRNSSLKIINQLKMIK